MLRRSQLYVPGNNEKMIAKAATLEADSIILDLEDAVPASEKASARSVVARLSKELDWGKKELCVRINAMWTPEHSLDVPAVKKIERVDSILVPKAEGDCSPVARRSGKALIPIVETAKGMMTLNDVARSKAVVAITYGAGDYASSVGGSVDAYLDNETVKTLIVAAAKAYGVEAVDNVFFDLEDLERFRTQAMAARSLGYTGKQVVHPSQIPVANQVFSPFDAEVEWAEKVVREFDDAGARKRGAIRVDGRLVDAVHYRLAKSILERKARS
ncbi:MAG: CoA ester lyase [Nitrososphaerota archaeon]|nr:CoA ester lyase [Nitrososphaerota archaeon]